MSYEERRRLEQVERVLEAHHMAVVGETLLQHVHDRSKCEGRNCTIHRPSLHHMRTWPAEWIRPIGPMVRICPHGVAHPDPDQVTYWQQIDQMFRSLHTCDGCCEGVVFDGEVVGPEN